MSMGTTDYVVEEARLNRFHLLILFWCSMLMTFDGYDLVIYGSVLPYLMSDWKISPVLAGIIGSSALFGMMIGALTLGISSDRFGRRRVILICLCVFGAAALTNGFVTNPTEFIICRVLTGVGLGGMVPNIVALMAENSSKSKRNIMITTMLCFFPVGGVIAAFSGKVVTPEFGWRANFFLAGVPLVTLPILLRYLPESISFLLANKRYDDADKILCKIAPSFKGTARQLVTSHMDMHEHGVRQLRTVQLFTEGRALNTLLIWVGFGLCMLMMYGLTTWLPKLMVANGYSLGSSLTFLLTLNIGAILGGLLSGWLADKIGGKYSLILFFLVAAVSIAGLGYKQNQIVLTILLMLAGATTIGTLGLVHAFAALFYPANVRSTGVGWAAAVGRFGAVAGPAVGGYLFAQDLPVNLNFLFFAVPGVIAAIAIALTSNKRGTESNTDVAVASVK
ncbi:major facilitator transporter [Caballeronia fortuita]|uniref:Major facilitator transporter n=1 Tax=Caballeronia fortuita TaxID=1777138 RepID=A0A158CAZ8_9BURK|nr:aromatic acid/H+ symport family MFS transporter [Caballeronia fortuita]SAK79451.1 major facilitator transporter [Caballeronia fortuita]